MEENRVLVLRGYLSRYVEELEYVPGWHRLPNGVVAHSDPVAVYMTDPSQSIEGDWKAFWRQVENVENYKELGEKAFRKVSADKNPERMLTFFSPCRLLDYWAPNSEVPVHPYPVNQQERSDTSSGQMKKSRREKRSWKNKSKHKTWRRGMSWRKEMRSSLMR